MSSNNDPQPSPTRRPLRQSEVLALDLPGVMGFLRRNLWRILTTGLIFGVVTAGLVLLVVPRTYEATATLIVVPPRFASKLKPEVLSVQGYQRLLESDAVVAQTVQRLIEKGSLGGQHTLRLGDELSTRIFVSRRAEETTLAPVIEAVSRAKSAEAASVFANTWVEVFLERTRELNTGALAPTIELIDKEYTREYQQLEEMEKMRVETADDYQVRLDEVGMRWKRELDRLHVAWDRRLVDFKKESEDHIAQFQVETRRQLEELAAERGLATGGVGAEDGLPGSGAGRPPELESKLLEVTSQRIRLAQTPRMLVLEKAISDDALWQAMALSQTSLLELAGRSLLTQEANPLHADLARRLSELELELESLTGAADRSWVSDVTAGLERLQREREAGLVKLISERARDFAEMQRDKAREIDEMQRREEQELGALTRQRDTHLQQIDRDLQNARETFAELATSYRQAELARAEQDLADVRMGAPAMTPLRPVSSGWVLKTLLAMVVGGTLAAVSGWLREVQSP